MARTVLIYGVILAAGAFALQWLEFAIFARTHPVEIYLVLLALAFMAIGIWAGASLFRRAPVRPEFQSNVKAIASLGISEREFEVLELLASGRSNKEISAELNVSLNTVKTHVARLYEKLDVRRRTQAVVRARELGMLP